MLSHIERNSSLGYSLKISDISASTPTEKKTKKKKYQKSKRGGHTLAMRSSKETPALQWTAISAIRKSGTLKTRFYLVTRLSPRIESKEPLKYQPESLITASPHFTTVA